MNADRVPQNTQSPQFVPVHDGHLDVEMSKTQSLHGMVFIGVHRRASAVPEVLGVQKDSFGDGNRLRNRTVASIGGIWFTAGRTKNRGLES
jgi:hypothetical protein